MADLKTNYVNDTLADAMGGRRRYTMINNSDGTVSFVDATTYNVVGDEYGADEINELNDKVNDLYGIIHNVGFYKGIKVTNTNDVSITFSADMFFTIIIEGVDDSRSAMISGHYDATTDVIYFYENYKGDSITFTKNDNVLAITNATASESNVRVLVDSDMYSKITIS